MGSRFYIINPTVFDMVQTELEKRKRGGSQYSGIIYRYNSKYKDKKCGTPHVTEEEVKAAFLSAYNKMVSEKAEIVANAETFRDGTEITV